MRTLVRSIRSPGGQIATILMAVTAAIVIGLTAQKVKSDTTSPQLQIQQLEQSLREHPGVFDWRTHNELRHLYSTKTPPDLRKAMEHADVILQHSLMDDYILHILSDWQLDKNTSIARANLLSKAQQFPDLQFLGAASLLTIGDLYAKGNNAGMAKSFYLKVADDTSSDMAQYRVLAQERLSGLGEPPEEAVERRGVSKYVALGDSYSSGEGSILYAWGKPVIDASGQELSFIQGTDTQSNKCHRAPTAYPELVKTYLGIKDNSFKFRACASAMQAQLFKHWEPDVYQCSSLPLGELLNPSIGNAGQWDEPAQLDAITSDVNLVTPSVGGNDIGFAPILKACVYVPGVNLTSTDDCLTAADKWYVLGAHLLKNGDTIKLHPAGDFPGTTWESCDHNPECETCRGQTITLPRLSAPDGLFQEIHRRAPQAAIRVLLYPLLFEDIPDSENVICKVGVGAVATFTGTRTNKLNKVAGDLNKIIRDGTNKAKEAGINIEAVDPNSRFKGHRLCNTSEEGVIRSSKGSYSSLGSVDAWIHGLILQNPQVWSPSGFSFHPNVLGQETFAQEIERTIKGARSAPIGIEGKKYP